MISKAQMKGPLCNCGDCRTRNIPCVIIIASILVNLLHLCTCKFMPQVWCGDNCRTEGQSISDNVKKRRKTSSCKLKIEVFYGAL
ncbi:hypothetical protein Fmac_016209 [Flemingia macrophylla]|uniref:Uncharacterized protein n=1 Tax=Flemingia macrophylla TaxID=520843 RepID=A0ABD1MGX8_9FABA